MPVPFAATPLQHAARPNAHHRTVSTSAFTSDSAGPGPGAGTGTGVGGGPGPGQGEVRLSLGDALNRLVDAAVEKVEAGEMGEAVALLKEGLNTFEPMFPNRWVDRWLEGGEQRPRTRGA